MVESADVFLDTNVLIYAALGKQDAPEKFAVARQIVLEEDYSTSAQVLSEFYVNATRKGRAPLSPAKAQEWVRTLAQKPCQPVDDRIVREGLSISQENQISYWDGAIIAAAQRLGCKKIYSEDLNHGDSFGAVTVVNPFINI